MKRIFYSKKVPILQNKVYPDPNTAKTAPFGILNIVMDNKTPFAFNADFDASLINYDKDYDNSVPSDVFIGYYDEIADHLSSQ